MEKMRNKASYILEILPGLLLSFAVMLAGIYAADFIGFLMQQAGILTAGSKTPVSGIFVAILLGMVIRNVVPLHERFKKGITFSMKFILRAGIILLGLRLSLMEALKLGAYGIPLIVACIAAALMITLYLTKKMGQSERLGTLIASGTSICGVTAIMATSPVIKAKENEISYAVANITIFGLTGMLAYPFLANLLFADEPMKAGLFLGTAIHDTAQVAGAALIYDQMFQSEAVVEVATVTKLTRNLFIIAIIPIVSYLFYQKGHEGADEKTKLPKWYTFIPLFVIGFLLLSVVRTIGDATMESAGSAFGFLAPAAWEQVYAGLSSFGTTYLLGMAMAGVGLSTNFKMFKGLGLKPFYIGLTAAVSVGIISLVFVSLFGGFVHM